MNSLEVSQYLIHLVLGPKPWPTEEISLDAALKIAKANDLLIAVADALDDSTNIPVSFQEPYRQLKLLEINSVELIRALLEQAMVDELPLLTIKSFLPFPYADTNIDIVAIESKRVDQYREMIKNLGFIRHRNLADIREPYKEMYYHIEHGRSDRTFPKIHLHRSISWNGVVYLDPKQLWQRHQSLKVREVSIPIPSPEDELLIMAAHAIFENKFIALYELVYLNWLTDCNLDWNYIIQTAKNSFWYEALKYFLAIACSLGKVLEMNIKVEVTVPDHIQFSTISFPLILPLSQTFQLTLIKLWRDIQHGHLAKLPRQLFTYFLVDCLWMYRKAQRKAASAKI